MAYGNTSVSALLNQARAALKKQQGFEEQVAAYEYDLSPKDQASYEKYASFLNNRIKQVQATDPSKALSLQRLVTGAQRSFTSSELTRESIAIAEGNGSKPQKLNKMISLYRRALENGDENLAQRIQLQADNLQVQIQNEAMAGAGRGGGGGGSGSKDPHVKGWEEAKGGLTNQIELLKEELASGKITTKQYLGGYTEKDGSKVKGLRETMQNLEDIRRTAGEYAQQSGDPSAANFYADFSKTMSSDQYQTLINQAGTKVSNGQVGGARVYDYNTGRWDFKQNKGEGGYINTPLGAMFKLKDESNNNIIGTDKDGNPIYLPKNQMNQLTEVKDNNKTKLSQFSGFLPGKENTPGTEYFGQTTNPNELIFTQNDKGEISGITPLMTAIDPRTGELNRDPITGEVRMLSAGDFNTAGTISDNPVVAAAQNATNTIVDPLVSDIKKTGAKDALDYGKIKAGQLLSTVGLNRTIDSVKKSLGSFGIVNPFNGGTLNGSGFGSFGIIKDLQNKADNLQKQAAAKAAADAQAKAAQFAADQARLNAANQEAIQRQAAAANYTPKLQKSVLIQSSPQLTSQIGKAAFNNKYLGGLGKLYNGAL